MKKLLSMVLSMVLVLSVIGSTVVFADVDKNKQFEDAFEKAAKKYNVEDLTITAGKDTYKTRELGEFKKWAEAICKSERETRDEIAEFNKTAMSEEEIAKIPTTYFSTYKKDKWQTSSISGIKTWCQYWVTSSDGRMSYIDSMNDAIGNWSSAKQCFYIVGSNYTIYLQEYTSGRMDYSYQDGGYSIVVTYSNNSLVTADGTTMTGFTNYSRFYY